MPTKLADYLQESQIVRPDVISRQCLAKTLPRNAHSREARKECAGGKERGETRRYAPGRIAAREGR